MSTVHWDSVRNSQPQCPSRSSHSTSVPGKLTVFPCLHSCLFFINTRVSVIVTWVSRMRKSSTSSFCSPRNFSCAEGQGRARYRSEHRNERFNRNVLHPLTAHTIVLYVKGPLWGFWPELRLWSIVAMSRSPFSYRLSTHKLVSGMIHSCQWFHSIPQINIWWWPCSQKLVWNEAC